MSDIRRVESKAVQVEVTPPPCERCVHREVCAIRPLIGQLRAVDVDLPVAHPALTPALAMSIECSFFKRDNAVAKDPSKPKQSATWTPEQRQAAAARMAHARAVQTAKKERSAA